MPSGSYGVQSRRRLLRAAVPTQPACMTRAPAALRRPLTTVVAGCAGTGGASPTLIIRPELGADRVAPARARIVLPIQPTPLGRTPSPRTRRRSLAGAGLRRRRRADVSANRPTRRRGVPAGEIHRSDLKGNRRWPAGCVRGHIAYSQTNRQSAGRSGKENGDVSSGPEQEARGCCALILHVRPEALGSRP